jgi:hypothetical protein
VLRSSEHLEEKVLYVLNNPVRQGLVSDWHKYPWVYQKQFVNTYSLAQQS